MKAEFYSRKVQQLVTSPQFTVFCATALMAESASARIALGLPDPSMLSVWGSAAVIGVIAYRMKKRK